MSKPIKAKAMSSEQIKQHVRMAGAPVVNSFEVHLKELRRIYEKSKAEGQNDYAGFLFALGEMGNIVSRDCNVRH